MNIIKIGFNKDENILKEGVFALGNFDGVHKGHQQLISKTKDLANSLNVGSNWGVIIFTPNTKLCFPKKYKNYEILTSNEQKLEIFEKLNVPNVVLVNFTSVCQYTALEFLNNILINKLKIKGLLTGENSVMGIDATPFKVLMQNSKEIYNIIYENVGLKQSKNNEIYSSSLIKKYLHKGLIIEANEALSRPFEIVGEVIHGNKLGRTIGTPTANLVTKPYVKLKHGIYATKVETEDGNIYNSVANFGIRPTIKEDNKQEILEVNIFNFNKDLYNKMIKVKFFEFIRPEAKFTNLEKLVEQINLDKIITKEILMRYK